MYSEFHFLVISMQFHIQGALSWLVRQTHMGLHYRNKSEMMIANIDFNRTTSQMPSLYSSS